MIQQLKGAYHEVVIELDFHDLPAKIDFQRPIETHSPRTTAMTPVNHQPQQTILNRSARIRDGPMYL
jgi:hypothetical protein